MDLILDTNFVIATEREASRGVPGIADAFLADRGEDSLWITFTIAGELACGRSAADRGYWQRLCQAYPVLPWTPDVAWQYGELYRNLQSKGTLIGVNDLWIAATALANNMALVTKNLREFDRVEGLTVVSY